MKDVMLAGKVDLARLQYPCFVSPKLDGYRAFIERKGVMSRNKILYPNKHVQEMFRDPRLIGLDGELLIGSPTSPNAMRNSSAVMSDADPVPGLLFHAFDYLGGEVTSDTPFTVRYSSMDVLLGKVRHDNIAIVSQTRCDDQEHLMHLEAQAVHAGYEGIMVRATHGPYKHGRSTTREGYLLKLKRFEDSEACVVGFEELQHNENAKDERGKRTSHKAGKVAGDTLGAIIVVDCKSGVEFSIGSGFTQAERSDLWALRDTLINRVARYKYFPTGSKERPRFPVFTGWRLDLPKPRRKK